MIQLRDLDGRTHYVAPSAIARVSEPGASAAWHGVRSIVSLFDGRVLECQDKPAEIAERVAALAERRTGDG